MNRRILLTLLVGVASSLPLLGTSRLSAAEPKDTTRILLISDAPDGHPWNTHEYRAGLRILKDCLTEVPGVQVTTVDAAEEADSVPGKLADADAVVLFVSQGARWVGSDAKRREAFRAFAAKGGGISALHWAVGAKEPQYIDFARSLWGGVHGGPDRKYVVEKFTVTPNADHPIAAGLKPFESRDEWYYQLKFAPEGQITPVLTVPIEGKDQTVAWAWERPDGGRSFGFTGLHFHANWGEKEYRQFVTRGVLWTAHREPPAEALDLSYQQEDLESPRPMEEKEQKKNDKKKVEKK